MKKKFVIITGAGLGLGKEFAKLYAEQGFGLVLIDRTEKNLEITSEEIKNIHPVEIHTITKDLSLPESSKEIYDEIKRLNLKIYGLVNNAGFGIYGKFSETDLEKEISMANLHVITPISLTKLFLLEMLKNKEGEVLNVSSLAGFQPGPMMSIYYATKAFLTSFTEAIARENKGSGVKISVLCPGVVNTHFRQSVAAEKEAKIKTVSSNPSDVAEFAIRAMRKGKVVCIPTLWNQFLSLMPRFVPRSTARNIVYKIQMKNRG